MNSISAIITSCVVLLLSKVKADCVSYGYDYVDGGNYYVDTSSPDCFSFGTEFFGCHPNDTQGGVDPILIAPDETEYFCSTIATDQDGVDQVSYCNVTDNEVYKSDMYSGGWMCIIEGLDFAWMRTFYVTAAPQITVTLTPSVTFSVTTTPSTTISTTSTSEYDTTLRPSTITVPSSTITKSTTVVPSKVTVTSTQTSTRTRKSRVFSRTWTTSTTTTCKTQSSRRDPTCTIHPTKGSLPSSASANSTGANISSGHKKRALDKVVRRDRRLPRGAIENRSLDQPTTTVVETTNIVSVYTTFTAPAVTETDTFYTTVTSTITPPPVTAYSGKARTTVTVTLPTPTRTITKHTRVTVWTKTTVWGTLTTATTIWPSRVVCKPTP